jgi:hypothetical protein
MAIKTRCLTPGAMFETHIQEESLSVQVEFGRKIDLTEAEAEILDALVHNQLEMALAQFWPEGEVDKATAPDSKCGEIKEISSMGGPGGSIEGPSGPFVKKKKKKKVKEWLNSEILKILVEG